MGLRADTASGTLSVTGQCSPWYPGSGSDRVLLTGLPNWQAGPYLPNQGDNVPCERVGMKGDSTCMLLLARPASVCLLASQPASQPASPPTRLPCSPACSRRHVHRT